MLSSVHRRWFLSQCPVGLGAMAASSLLGQPRLSAATPEAKQDQPNRSLAPRKPHFPGKAKAVIHLMMAGAPSQLDLFDEKPLLRELEGKPLPQSVIGDQRYAFIQPDAAVLGPQFKFARHGESGAHFPRLSRIWQKLQTKCAL
jgi:hypothetical protein